MPALSYGSSTDKSYVANFMMVGAESRITLCCKVGTEENLGLALCSRIFPSRRLCDPLMSALHLEHLPVGSCGRIPFITSTTNGGRCGEGALHADRLRHRRSGNDCT